jgi:hypothetical protein
MFGFSSILIIYLPRSARFGGYAGPRLVKVANPLCFSLFTATTQYIA